MESEPPLPAISNLFPFLKALIIISASWLILDNYITQKKEAPAQRSLFFFGCCYPQTGVMVITAPSETTLAVPENTGKDVGVGFGAGGAGVGAGWVPEKQCHE